MSAVVETIPTKPSDVAQRDRDVGGAAAFVLFGAFVVALFFVVRRVKHRALEDRADRELRDEIEDLERERR